jgi:hypothetical protein
MCSLCGVLGGRGHWTDTSTNPEAFKGGAATTRQRERQQRTRLVNTVLGHYGLSVSDWAATSYVLRGKTGQTAMVDNLAELWAAAEQLGKGPCDPLDDTLLDTLSRGRRP